MCGVIGCPCRGQCFLFLFGHVHKRKYCKWRLLQIGGFARVISYLSHAEINGPEGDLSSDTELMIPKTRVSMERPRQKSGKYNLVVIKLAFCDRPSDRKPGNEGRSPSGKAWLTLAVTRAASHDSDTQPARRAGATWKRKL